MAARFLNPLGQSARAQVAFKAQAAGNRQRVLRGRIGHGTATPKGACPEVLKRPPVERGEVLRLFWFLAHGVHDIPRIAWKWNERLLSLCFRFKSLDLCTARRFGVPVLNSTGALLYIAHRVSEFPTSWVEVPARKEEIQCPARRRQRRNPRPGASRPY